MTQESHRRDHVPPARSLEVMKAVVGEAKSLCLFGIGALLLDCYNQLVLGLGRHPDLLCDNAQNKWGKEFFGRKCVSPSELAGLREGMAVVITVRNFEAIYSQLLDLGIDNVFIACFDRGFNIISGIIRPKLDFAPSAKASPPLSVRGRWALVTGASRGIGRRIALEMARLGSNIVAHSRSVDHVARLADECAPYGVEVLPISANLGDLDDVEEMLVNLEKTAPPIDIVFNNAGISCNADIWSLESDTFLNCLAVNTVTPIRICNALIPGMLKRGFGRLVNISSSIDGRPSEIGYACSKAALNKFVRDVAPALAGTGVSLSLVDPGWIQTDMTHYNESARPVESVIPGALLGVLVNGEMNGRWVSAQDYAGLSIEAAVQKAEYLLSDSLG